MMWDFDRSSEMKPGLPKRLVLTLGIIIVAAGLAPQATLSSDEMSRIAPASNDPAAMESAIMSKEVVALPKQTGSDPAGQSLGAKFTSQTFRSAVGVSAHSSGPTSAQDSKLVTQSSGLGMQDPAGGVSAHLSESAGAQDGKLSTQSSGLGVQDPAGPLAEAQIVHGDNGKPDPAAGLAMDEDVYAGRMIDPAGSQD